MIQRIQTIFLALASMGFLGQFATDFATSSVPAPNLMADQIYEVQDNVILLVLTILGAILSLVAIFLFKNRQLQMRISIIVLILAIFLPLVAFLLVYNEGTALIAGTEITDQIGTYLPIISIVTAFLAYKGVKKDEKLVRSMDRLR